MRMIENQMVVNIREVKVACSECGGRGFVNDIDGDGWESEVTCEMCEGEGTITILR